MEIVLRCVIVPGINNNENHFKEIAQLSLKYNSIKEIHILPYHSYGANKYEQIGQHYALEQLKTVESSIYEEWIKSIKSYGATNVIKG